MLSKSQPGACKAISLLVKQGFDIDLPNPFHKQHAKPLWYAIKAGHRNAVRLLVELGADVKALNDCESPALMVATNCYQPQVLLQLLTMGLDPNVQGQASSIVKVKTKESYLSIHS